METPELTFDIYVISRLTHIYYTAELRKLNVTMGQFPFIMGLEGNDGISQEQLSGKLRIGKSTTAVVVGQLVANGIVARSADQSDRRSFRLELTAKGRALIPEIKKVIAGCYDLVTDGFSDGEKKILEELLRRVRMTSEERLRPPKKRKRRTPDEGAERVSQENS